MTAYAVANVEEIDEFKDGHCLCRPVRLHLGISAFGASAWTARSSGDTIIEEHDEGDPTSDEELFLVMRGHAAFELDGDLVDAPAGTFVFAPPGMKRRAIAEEAGTSILLVEGTPGQAYEARGWELWSPLVPLYAAGGFAELAERLRKVVEIHPQYPMLFFNLACAESLSGQTPAALDHLQRAIEMSEEFRVTAKSDSDLDAIRDEPVFKTLVGD
jgi:tetratricopeptide (TPR) repeat protein